MRNNTDFKATNGTTAQEVLPYNIYSQYGDLLLIANKKTTRIVDMGYELNECYYCTTSPQGKVLFETVNTYSASSSTSESATGANGTVTANATSSNNSTNGTSSSSATGQSSASTGETIEHCTGIFRMCQMTTSKASSVNSSNVTNATYYNASDSTTAAGGSGGALSGGCSVASDHYAVGLQIGWLVSLSLSTHNALHNVPLNPTGSNESQARPRHNLRQ